MPRPRRASQTGAAITASAAAVLLLSSSAGLSGAEPPRAQVEFFEAKIRPVLVEHCYECHSVAAKKHKGGLFLDSRAGVRKGGDSGPAVVPGKRSRGRPSEPSDLARPQSTTRVSP